MQVVRHISEQIARGELVPGDKIPSEREMREQWGISKATANKVVAQLKAEGYVYARVGVGTVVASPSGLPGAGPRSMWQRIRDNGLIRLANERSERTTGAAFGADVPDIVKAALGGTAESDYVFRRRVIYRDELPYCVATSWFLPALLNQWPGVVDRLLADESIPEGTPRYIADRVARELDSCTDCVEAVSAEDPVAADLRVDPGSALLRVVSTITAEGWPVEVGDYFYPARTSLSYTYAV
jgi:GntR family transcriptional regulator